MDDALLSPLSSPLARGLRQSAESARKLATAGLNLRQGLAERAVRSRLQGLEVGQLVLRSADQVSRFGPGKDSSVQADVTILDPAVWSALLQRGTLGAAESYAKGQWFTDDLAAVTRLFARNQQALQGLDRGWAKLSQPLLRLTSKLRRNSRAGARRNIAAHYDLSNEFFGLWLDPTWTYSAGIFEDSTSSMEQASVAKLDRLCRKLDLQAHDHLLEIGTGWGSMALHAAQRYGCRVTTTTISKEQHALAQERVKAANLQDRVKVLFRDYRDLEGRFDKLVSIEMIEAVGHSQFPTFFAHCADLLTPSGIAAIQAITIKDQAYERARKQVDFIRQYIFPGSTIPSMTRLLECSTGASDLRLVSLEDITPHYARTLWEWRRKFYAQLDKARSLGYDESFLRLWEYYLAYCEGGFAERHIGSVQLLFAKPEYRARLQSMR